MSYKLSAAMLLRHLAISYRKLNREKFHEEKKAKENHREKETRQPNEKRKIIAELRHNLIGLEKKYANMILDKEIDREKMVMLAEKIQALKKKLL